MLNCILLGKYAKRTPLAYAAYQSIFAQKIKFVDDIRKADLVVLGYVKDIDPLSPELNKGLEANPQQKLVVLSEEPFWDTLWGGEFWQRYSYTETLSGQRFYHANLNHVTSSIYRFEHLPYFITTDNRYSSRYCMMLKEKKKGAVKGAEFRYDAAFVAEKRKGEKFDVDFPELQMKGLCRYRSLLTERMQSERNLVLGQGWRKQKKRQNIPDWHLDKLALLDGNVKILSALENTYHPYYITEKIFDAYAVGAIPLYYAPPASAILKMVDECSLINLYGLSVEQAVTKLKDFEVTSLVIDAYKETLNKLSKIFNETYFLVAERERIAREIIKEFEAIAETKEQYI